MSSEIILSPHNLIVSKDGIINEGDSDYTFSFQDGSIKSLFVEPNDGSVEFELMTCKDESDHLYMNHLEVPQNHRGNNLGSLGIAFFYYLLRSYGYKKYAVKFGEGRASEKFLYNLGFSSSVVQTGQEGDYSDTSVMVGEFVSVGGRNQYGYDWTLRPIDISTFPTDFFELKL